MAQKEYPYKVSASIITYNQAEYIQKAIGGAIAQEVDFPYEIIIGDDCSTDGTREILLDYKQKHPDLIKLHLHNKRDEGIPGRLNNIINIRSAQGQYIAFCDGDDYWISKDKLQKQADFMDANSGYSFCFHDTLFSNESKKGSFYSSDKNFSLRKSRSFTYKNLVRDRLVIGSSSTFFRTCYFHPLPDWFWDVYIADHFLKMIAARHGPFRYIKELKCVRVMNPKSVSNDYFSEREFARIKQNDLLIMNENFRTESEQPLSLKAQDHLFKSKKRYSQRKYFSSMQEMGSAIAADARILGWICRKGLSKLRYQSLRMIGKIH